MVQLAMLLLFAGQPTNPFEIGRQEIAKVAGSRASDVTLQIKPGGTKESFSIEGNGQNVTITAPDQNGAMYGAFEFAERLHQHPDQAWATKFKDEPFLPDRGLNLFLTLPWDYKKNDTDYDVAALTDSNRWWFANEDYWTTLLDLMAKSRLNWLDIHGGWDISVTNAPNMYAYFVTSPSFPLVGVPQDVKDKDLAQLNHVIDMAHQRGIRVSLMCYEANLKIPQNPTPPYKATEENIYKYTKEVVEQMIRKAPGLDAIGYRIGESGHGENFFTCYDEAIKASGREIPIVTRSWITRKQKVLPLARASKDFTVEIKYNGEQWGAPYIVAGGRMANWGSYSYEDYLSDSEVAGAARPRAARMWPGWPAEDDSSGASRPSHANWPDEPYKIVWQVRANGTHRIFPFYNPDWVRSSIKCMKMGTASGYTIEGEDAYFPKSPDYYLANPSDKYCTWIHQRDEMYWMTWGRLGYDPDVPEDTFDSRAVELLGSGSKELVGAWKAASVMVPTAYMLHAIGPDHRDHAPELEWGGDTASFVDGQGFDTSMIAPINEECANDATHGDDLRFSSLEIAEHLVKAARDIRTSISNLPQQARGRAAELRQAIALEADLGEYFGGRVVSARAVAQVMSGTGREGQYGGLGAQTDAFVASAKAYHVLAANDFYKPFTDRLRMHTNAFSWRSEDSKVQAEAQRIAGLPSADGIVPPTDFGGGADDDSRLTWKQSGPDIICQVTATAGAVDLFVKPLPSSTFFHRLPMKKSGDHFEASFKRGSLGHDMMARCRNGAARWIAYPGASGDSPYAVVPSIPGPTPQIYAADEAMSFLDPKTLTPDKFGAILIGSRANNFFHRFNRATQRKLLDPVERGMKLVILQEDFNKDKLDFLPKPLRFEGFVGNTFDPGGQLGLEMAAAPGILNQRFLPSNGWDIYGNGALARMKFGKGEVWVTSARLMQSMVYPSAAKDFVKMLSLGGKAKPTVIVDSCSEGAVFTSSCHQDLMNSHDIPFLTLGEAIAQEQGMNSFTMIPGPTWNDDVLGGKGQAMANKFVRDQVIALSKRPTPANLSVFEKLRKERKKELLKSLGLDPMPVRTPLNARITGTIQRNGYHIEKLVFESRPRFYVTGHVYVPDKPENSLAVGRQSLAESGDPLAALLPSANGQRRTANEAAGRYPVIVNVNGHWAHKKDEDRIQLRCAFQALQGYIAIAIDSPGWSFEGKNLIERRPEGTHDDFMLVEGGTNTTGYYVWDAIRALDYMATRPDTDMSHIGLTGASGGGLATLYTFAADDRYTAAVPVVYLASMELAPDNGCLCNHVPGTSQIGDRSDVMAIQAPKPVLIMGAQNDGEFPPEATRLTAKKMQDSWKLFGKDGDVYVHIFAGGHDYNQPMRETMIGFFNRYLKQQGDGTPVPQPHLEAIDSEDRQLLALDPPAAGERTMRDLSKEYLANAPQNVSAAQAIAINGGRPATTPLNYKELDAGETRAVTFEPEPGLTTPGILVLPKGPVKGVVIHVADAGKASELANPQSSVPKPGFAHLYIDGLGTGELAGLELRYPVYTGRAVAFTAGWQIVRAAEAMKKYSSHIEIVGRGAMSSQAVMWAGLLDSGFGKVSGIDCLGAWADVFKDGVDPIAIQPRAHLCGSLENLRKHVKNGEWRH